MRRGRGTYLFEKGIWSPLSLVQARRSCYLERLASWRVASTSHHKVQNPLQGNVPRGFFTLVTQTIRLIPGFA